MKKCPYCAEEIQDEAIVCRYCGRDLPKFVEPVVKNSTQNPGCLTIYFTNVLRRLVWLFIISGILYLLSLAQSNQTSATTATVTRAPTHKPIPTATKPALAWPQNATAPNCNWWYDIDRSDIGETRCVMGIVDSITGNNESSGAARIYFRNSVSMFYFIDDAHYYPDLKEWICVSGFGRISINNSNVFFMHLEDGLKPCN